MQRWWAPVRHLPQPPSVDLAPPLLELQANLQLWDQACGMSLYGPVPRGHPGNPLPLELSFPRVVPEQPIVVAWGTDFVDLQWVVREMDLPFLGRPATFDCRIELVNVGGGSNLPSPCTHETDGTPRLVAGRPGCACWGARVSNLLGHGQAYRFRVSARTNGLGWSSPGPWSDVFRMPKAPKAPATPHIVEMAPGRGADTLDALVRLYWWVDNEHEDAAQLELVDCDVQQRAVSAAGLAAAQGACGARRREQAHWELPHDCMYAEVPWPLRRDAGLQAWECVVRVPAEPQADSFGRVRALRFQFRVRARNSVGPGPWGPWSEPASHQRAAAAAQALPRS